jgi:hypothetical protein
MEILLINTDKHNKIRFNNQEKFRTIIEKKNTKTEICLNRKFCKETVIIICTIYC